MPNAHIDTLSARHARLDASLAEETRRPSPDQHRLTQLKREKLKLKEAITAQH
ncbi:YdcH family protein [Polymorphobacter sp.]|uniref:YdcH family protein n=1 Tax=Polymorphobacter sp. TaxID=1909290 RepID=UPI003F722278